jgi:predicted O-methyltransferase YrrM
MTAIIPSRTGNINDFAFCSCTSIFTNLLKPGGLLIADNVLYRGLPAQIDLMQENHAAVDPETVSTIKKITEKTRLNAEALVRFNNLVKKDVHEQKAKSLMLPVRDGMMAVMWCVDDA